MKKYFNVIFLFFVSVLVLFSIKVEAIMPLIGKIIVIDAGHGGKDPGTSYNSILEKDINLEISLELEKLLSSMGATVILTREGDYDLSTPKANYRKKSDFDNRIKLINESNANLYLSIHLNYLSDKSYKGPQVFYNSSKDLAQIIQNNMNELLEGDRNIKQIPNDTYMYDKLKVDGVLIECGFLSNDEERSLLQKKEYQIKVAKSIMNGILEYY